MYLSTFATFALFVSSCSAQISRQECVNQGGQVVGDIGNGAIFGPDYICESNGLPPSDTVVAQPGEPIASEGEVCCGGTGLGISYTMDPGLFPPEEGEGGDVPFTRPEISDADCMVKGGVIVEDIGDGSIHMDNYICDESGLPPIATVMISRQAIIPAEGGQVCCQVVNITDPDDGLPFPEPAAREEYDREECLDASGAIVGDIGNGAIFDQDYICESNNLPPIANIVNTEPPVAIEGEVCCGEGLPINETVERLEVSRQECVDQGGQVIGDIGDGSTKEETYACDSNGEPPIADVIAREGEPIAIEGEVCCGLSDNLEIGFQNNKDEEDGSVRLASSFMLVVASGLLLWLL